MVSAQQSGLAVDAVCEKSIQDGVWPNYRSAAFPNGVKDIALEQCNRRGVVWGNYGAAQTAL